MVRVFISDISSFVLPNENSALFLSLPTYRKEKILSLRNEEDKRRSFVAGLLLQYALKQYGASDADVYLGDKGKPLCPGIFFNLSHSYDKVICAVGERNVGCDVEKIRIAPRERIRRFFCPEEIQYLSLSGDWDKTFFSLWTAKESYIKMTGEGLTKTLTDFSVLDNTFSGCFNLRQWEEDGYSISVCTREEIEEKLTFVPMEALF